jgi:hypothetical protein
MDAALDERYSHHEAHEGHEVFGNYYISISLLRALRDLRGEMSVSVLVAA